MSEINDLASIVKATSDGLVLAVKGIKLTGVALLKFFKFFKLLFDWCKYHKSKGETNISNLMLKKGSDVSLRQVPTHMLDDLLKQAKSMGVLVTVMPDFDLKDGYTQIMIGNEDALIFDEGINANLQQKFNKVNLDKIKSIDEKISAYTEKIENNKVELDVLKDKIEKETNPDVREQLEKEKDKLEKGFNGNERLQKKIEQLNKQKQIYIKATERPIEPVSYEEYYKENKSVIDNAEKTIAKLSDEDIQIVKPVAVAEALDKNCDEVPTEGNKDYIYSPSKADVYVERTWDVQRDDDGEIKVCSHTLEAHNADGTKKEGVEVINDKGMLSSTYDEKLSGFLEELGFDKNEHVLVIQNKKDFEKQFKIDGTPSKKLEEVLTQSQSKDIQNFVSNSIEKAKDNSTEEMSKRLKSSQYVTEIERMQILYNNEKAIGFSCPDAHTGKVGVVEFDKNTSTIDLVNGKVVIGYDDNTNINFSSSFEKSESTNEIVGKDTKKISTKEFNSKLTVPKQENSNERVLASAKKLG